MERQIRPTKTEKILLILTAAFLCLMLVLLFHVRAGGAAGNYAVETERAAASSELTPDVTPMDINTAGVEELATLPGIGEKLAERIVKYREDNGDFASVNDLVNVGGIGEGKLDALRDYVSVG
ncbi:helix-hairpin-helix domain-containing protein [Oscillibacter sp.]|uniref:ComEA family DNA-binding protein n=1 Tax=Oscillibacter sp. TaxID=1945593 RepID=UPI003395F910